MKSSTLTGLFLAVLVTVLALVMLTDNPAIFLNVPGLLVVLGGTAAATLVSYPIKELKKLIPSLRKVLNDESIDIKSEVETMVSISWLLARGKLGAVQDLIDKNDNPFMRTGLQMALDSMPVAEIREVLRWRMTKLRQAELAEVQIFRSMALFAPAFGMVGTLLGLIHMLGVLGDAGVDVMGGHMALALMTTLYGIVLANLIFKPLAIKLERRMEQRLMLMNLLREGMVLLAERRTPAFIRETMKTFIVEREDEMSDRDPMPTMSTKSDTPDEAPVMQGETTRNEV